MECDWDCDKVIRGMFSDANEAVNYIKENYYLLDDVRDICIPDYPIKGDVFKQYGYDYGVHPSDILEDDDGLYYWGDHYEAGVEERWREYLNTKTVFTLRGVVLDGLLK